MLNINNNKNIASSHVSETPRKARKFAKQPRVCIDINWKFKSSSRFAYLLDKKNVSVFIYHLHPCRHYHYRQNILSSKLNGQKISLHPVQNDNIFFCPVFSDMLLTLKFRSKVFGIMPVNFLNPQINKN